MKEEVVEKENNENLQDNMPKEKVSVFEVGKTLVEEELNELGDSNEDIKKDLSLKCQEAGISNDKEKKLKEALDNVETFAETTKTGPAKDNKKHKKEIAEEVKVRGNRQEERSGSIKKEETNRDISFENERG